MKQGTDISYDVILKQRDLHPESCSLDSAKVTETTARIAKYNSDRKKEKEAEEQEFNEGAHASGAGNNQSVHNASGSAGRAGQSAAALAPTQQQSAPAKQNCQEVLGYLPKRGDFE